MFYSIIKIFFAVIWTYVLFRGVIAVERNDKAEQAIRLKTKREVGDATTNAWLALYEDTKKRANEQLHLKDEEIANLRKQVEYVTTENGRLTLLLSCTPANGVRGKLEVRKNG